MGSRPVAVRLPPREPALPACGCAPIRPDGGLALVAGGLRPVHGPAAGRGAGRRAALRGPLRCARGTLPWAFFDTSRHRPAAGARWPSAATVQDAPRVRPPPPVTLPSCARDPFPVLAARGAAYEIAGADPGGGSGCASTRSCEPGRVNFGAGLTWSNRSPAGWSPRPRGCWRWRRGRALGPGRRGERGALVLAERLPGVRPGGARPGIVAGRAATGDGSGDRRRGVDALRDGVRDGRRDRPGAAGRPGGDHGGRQQRRGGRDPGCAGWAIPWHHRGCRRSAPTAAAGRPR